MSAKNNNLEGCCPNRIFGGQRNLAGMLPTALPYPITSCSTNCIFILNHPECITLPYIYCKSLNNQLNRLPQTQESVQSYQNTQKKLKFSAENTMRTKVKDPSSAAALSRNLKRRRPIPQRGQIKMKIAAKAFQSLVSIVSASSAQYLNSPRKKSQY
ncbi:hypothetical protein C2S51_014348 [Perilla frutescens var. frutescens]|nr:hypothetical protein C2S51_014348 [Perilla frutescens var. frutescens]